jgi:hypothetical protein
MPMPDCLKGATSKFAAMIAITKETNNITHEVNIYRATKGVPIEGVLSLRL